MTYISVPSGTFSPTGTSSSLAAPIQLATPANLPGGNTAYTLVVGGQSGQTGNLAPRFFLIPDYTASTLTIPQGSAAIRVVNVSLAANPLGLYSTLNGAPSAALATGLGSVSYGYDVTTNAYVAVPVTQLANLAVVDTTNTGAAAALSATSNLNSVNLLSGGAYTLYLYGQPNNTSQPLSATWVQDFP